MQTTDISTLLVDDNTTFLNTVFGVLKQVVGVQVVGCAKDGLEALELVFNLRPELVLLDLSMPRLGGLELATRLVALPTPPTIIILSMHDSDAYRQAAQRAGAAAFVNKDNFMAELVPLLESLISERQQRQQKEANP
ncbi:two-component system response regulator [Rhodoferax lacus]|uniref:Two-component system response regulator n=1 Tax=Rhodoferax lacus TaxID=2184758 RepID=A0A3E1REK8_9BURK|nr:response regulator [Rhodoferax lacus]RFO97661.1 two-component system response regulator [Rhodoferax lacus]